MRIFHIWNTAGVASIIAKYMDRLFDTDSLVVHRLDFDPYGFTTYGELWNCSAGMFILKSLLLTRMFDIIHVHSLDKIIPFLKFTYGKKPTILHYHGDDVRGKWILKMKYLSKADTVLYSTPDLLDDETPEYAVYMPNPVDFELFYPKPFIAPQRKKRILIASDSNWDSKGTNIAIRALSRVKDEVNVSIIGYGRDFDRTIALASSLGLQLNVLPKISHEKMNEYYWNADVIIDQFRLGSLGMVSLEAIACGRPVITYVSSEYSEYKDFPLKDVNTEEGITDAINRADVILWEKEYTYLKKYHSVETIIKKLLRIYEEVL